ncbi:hypothetical protein SALBM217S_10480 [Streptomyces griseoloalbus]
MRRTRVLTAVLTLAAGLLAGGPPALAADAPDPAPAAVPKPAADTYTWRNARIDGGGFVPGIVFNRGEPDLAYARTDIGGAYRWQESTRSWIPLLDSVGWDDWGHTGVVSIASDSADPDRVYAAVGTYTNDWDPGNGAVMRSGDRGASWRKTVLPFKLGGNMPGRGMGERLAVDPHDNDVLYLGAPSGHGLWRSTDAGVTWSEVTSFPNPGNYVEDPDDASGYASDNQGVVWVTFDESTGTAGSPTRTVYVGVADKENAVYRSTDAGATWERLAGQPTGYLAHKGVLDAENGHLYLAYSDTGGPYDGGKGRLYRYATATGTWTDISPVAEADTYFGFSGLTVDRQNPGTVMATAYSSWWPDTQIFRSTDSGATWTQAWRYTSYPHRENRYVMASARRRVVDLGRLPHRLRTDAEPRRRRADDRPVSTRTGWRLLHRRGPSADTEELTSTARRRTAQVFYHHGRAVRGLADDREVPRRFRPRSCEPSALPLFRARVGRRGAAAFPTRAGRRVRRGGNTANLLDGVAGCTAVDRLLREAYAGGTLLCGISAGAQLLGRGSHTDSFGPLTHLPDGLGLLPGSACPHYDSEPGRRPADRAAVASGALSAGWAVEDGAAALFTDGRLTEAVTRTPDARLYRVRADTGAYGADGAVEEAVPCRLLGGDVTASCGTPSG